MRLPLRSVVSVVLIAGVLLVCPAAAHAQAPDAIGIRAQGMGGAFTAVADDATASWWNPAGLAAGSLLNLIVEYGEVKDPPTPDTLSHRGFALAFPALGVSYYRFAATEARTAASTGDSSGIRQDPGMPGVQTLDVSQFGATFGQSLGRHLVVASTVKLLRADGETEGGLDVGAMTIYGIVRAGVTVRNVTEPTFGDGELAITLKRQVRAGVALSSATSTAFGGATLAFDADLWTIPTLFGDERRVAAGGEIWTKQRWIGGRAGVSASTIGDRRTSFAGGVSVAVKHGFFVDAQLTGGSDPLRNGWGGALRLTF